MYTCVSKVRNSHNIITGYNIKRADGTQKVGYIPASIVKKNILAFRAQFDNLTLTSDNRLVDKAKEDEPPIKDNNKQKFQATSTPTSKNEENTQPADTKIILNRRDVIAMFMAAQKIAQSLGVPNIRLMISGQHFKTNDGQVRSVDKYSFAWSVSDKQTVSIIVSPQNENAHIETPSDCRRLFSFRAGDSGKIDMGNTKISVLMLSEIDWQNTVNADEMFYQLDAEKLVIKKSKADKLTNMYGFCKDQLICAVNFDKFIVPNLRRATAMFKGCENLKIENVKIKGLSFKNARFVGEMFRTDKHDLQHDKNIKYSDKKELKRYSREDQIKAINSIMHNYGDQLIEFFKYAFASYVNSIEGYADVGYYGGVYPGEELNNLRDAGEYQANVILEMTEKLAEIPERSGLFIRESERDEKKYHVIQHSNLALEYVLYAAILQCLGWTGYNRKGTDQPIDDYMYNTDVCNKFLFSTSVNNAQNSQTSEELDRSTRLGDPNRQLVKQMIKDKRDTRSGYNVNRMHGTPIYDDQTIKAIKDIYGIDLMQDKDYMLYNKYTHPEKRVVPKETVKPAQQEGTNQQSVNSYPKGQDYESDIDWLLS